MAYMESFEFSALYTLPHSLSREAESPHGVHDGHVVWGCGVHEGMAQFFRNPNPPWCAWRQLLASNQASIDPAMKCGRGHAEDLGRLHDRNRLLLVGGFARRLKARDLMIAAEAANLLRCETLAVR